MTSVVRCMTPYAQCSAFRLPGEAEWEYAARAGTTAAFFTGAITKLQSTGDCAQDMKGLGYGAAPLVDPWGELKMVDPKEAVVLRGGGPITPAARCRSAAHFSVTRSGRGGGIGFRHALVQRLEAQAARLVAARRPARPGLPAGRPRCLSRGAGL